MIHPFLSLKEKTPDGYFSVIKIVAIIVKIRVILWVDNPCLQFLERAPDEC